MLPHQLRRAVQEAEARAAMQAPAAAAGYATAHTANGSADSGVSVPEAERLRQLQRDRAQLQLRKLQADAGLISKQAAVVAAAGLEWLYDDPERSRAARERQREEYLLGKPISQSSAGGVPAVLSRAEEIATARGSLRGSIVLDAQQQIEQAEPTEVAGSATELQSSSVSSAARIHNTAEGSSGGLFLSKDALVRISEDALRKLREDPVFLIKQAELAQQQLRQQHPLWLQQQQQQLEQRQAARDEQQKKLQKRERKERRRKEKRKRKKKDAAGVQTARNGAEENTHGGRWRRGEISRRERRNGGGTGSRRQRVVLGSDAEQSQQRWGKEVKSEPAEQLVNLEGIQKKDRSDSGSSSTCPVTSKRSRKKRRKRSCSGISGRSASSCSCSEESSSGEREQSCSRDVRNRERRVSVERRRRRPSDSCSSHDKPRAGRRLRRRSSLTKRHGGGSSGDDHCFREGFQLHQQKRKQDQQQLQLRREQVNADAFSRNLEGRVTPVLQHQQQDRWRYKGAAAPAEALLKKTDEKAQKHSSSEKTEDAFAAGERRRHRKAENTTKKESVERRRRSRSSTSGAEETTEKKRKNRKERGVKVWRESSSERHTPERRTFEGHTQQNREDERLRREKLQSKSNDIRRGGEGGRRDREASGEREVKEGGRSSTNQVKEERGIRGAGVHETRESKSRNGESSQEDGRRNISRQVGRERRKESGENVPWYRSSQEGSGGRKEEETKNDRTDSCTLKNRGVQSGKCRAVSSQAGASHASSTTDRRCTDKSQVSSSRCDSSGPRDFYNNEGRRTASSGSDSSRSNNGNGLRKQQEQQRHMQQKLLSSSSFPSPRSPFLSPAKKASKASLIQRGHANEGAAESEATHTARASVVTAAPPAIPATASSSNLQSHVKREPCWGDDTSSHQASIINSSSKQRQSTENSESRNRSLDSCRTTGHNSSRGDSRDVLQREAAAGTYTLSFAAEDNPQQKTMRTSFLPPLKEEPVENSSILSASAVAARAVASVSGNAEEVVLRIKGEERHTNESGKQNKANSSSTSGVSAIASSGAEQQNERSKRVYGPFLCPATSSTVQAEAVAAATETAAVQKQQQQPQHDISFGVTEDILPPLAIQEKAKQLQDQREAQQKAATAARNAAIDQAVREQREQQRRLQQQQQEEHKNSSAFSESSNSFFDNSNRPSKIEAEAKLRAFKEAGLQREEEKARRHQLLAVKEEVQEHLEAQWRTRYKGAGLLRTVKQQAFFAEGRTVEDFLQRRRARRMKGVSDQHDLLATDEEHKF